MNKLNSPWRTDFPLLNTITDKPLIYLDSAATAQKPYCVTERMQHFYHEEYSTVHRGIHHLSSVATQNVEDVRRSIARFIHAESASNIIFTKGSTEAINLVANTFPVIACERGSEIIITEMEHHANIIPWQMAAQRYELKLIIWPVRDNGTLVLEDLSNLVTDKTRLIALSHVSNVLGTVNPIRSICQWAKSKGIATLVDGAQGIMHETVDVQLTGCDFYVFSGHKLYGPTGTGILYISDQWLESLPPWQGGGAMIEDVDLTQGCTYQPAPWKFETGTPNITGILGLGTAVQYIETIGSEQIQTYENAIMDYALEQLTTISSLTLLSPPRPVHTGVISFNLGEHHAFDVGSFLDKYGIAIRTGHHCALPLLKRYKLSAICRASFALYTDQSDIDALVDGLKKIEQLLGK
ncbi:cysteine desulfurase CsdA [Vibrio sp. HA2012]|uniref:SufS family cysteine desulfurase n=1 Tax=Vibrio sp. HA2012 TaxID=1971595 RepID=UPI000C2BB69C|nr:SufS family cysteine desulfurase [Vibrio sp. HA2012]PJC87720.1 cysteine desulfurase CsdA [Vibrio sp. HA2012]